MKTNNKWLATLLIQVVTGIVLYFFGDEGGKALGLILLGGSGGTILTGNMKAKG